MRDVAKLAAVSQATVSNYFNKPESVTEPRRLAIRGAIEELGYVRDESARHLRAGDNPTIGNIVFELTSPVAIEVGGALEVFSRDDGMRMLTANSGGEASREAEYLELFESQRVAGIIISPSHEIENDLIALRRRGTPCVMNGNRPASPELRSVSFDDVHGGYLVARHFLDIGRRRIAFVGGTLNLPQVSNRLQGASAAVAEVPGASLELIHTAQRTLEGGQEVGHNLLQRSPENLPEAIFAVNDLLAIGILRTLVVDGNVSVPEQVAVAGYDDSQYAQAGALPLTSVRTPCEKNARALYSLLLADMAELSGCDTPDGEPRHMVFEPELVVRASSLGFAGH